MKLGEMREDLGANIVQHFESLTCPYSGFLDGRLSLGLDGFGRDRGLEKGKTSLEIGEIGEDMDAQGGEDR